MDGIKFAFDILSDPERKKMYDSAKVLSAADKIHSSVSQDLNDENIK